MEREKEIVLNLIKRSQENSAKLAESLAKLEERMHELEALVAFAISEIKGDETMDEQ